MGRRLNSIASLLDGFNATYDSIGRVMRDRDMQQVANAKPTTDTGFTPAQGEQLRAAADSGQYDVTWDAERGQYTVRPKSAPDMEGAIAPGQRTSFLGKTYDQAPDEATISRDRQMAMAGVLEKHGDPTAGLRMRDLIRQGDIAEQGLAEQKARSAREAALFPTQQRTAELQLAQAERVGKQQAATDAADAAMTKKWDERLTQPDGTKRTATPDDHLWMTQQRAYALADAGDLKGALEAFQQHAAQSFIKIQLETAQRTEAVNKALAGIAKGDYSGAMEVYNKFLPDGMTVTAVKPGKGGSLLIERKDANGNDLPPQVVKSVDELRVGVQSVANPAEAWKMSQTLFQNSLEERRTRAAEAGAAATQAAAGRAAAEFDAAAPQRRLAQTLASLQTELLTPGTTPARRAEIQGLLAGAKGADNNEPADVKVARALVASGSVPDMQTALNYAMNNPDKVHKAFVDSGLKNMMKPADAVKQADEVMREMGYIKRGAAWSMGGGSATSFANEADAEAAAKAGKIKPGDRITINGQTGTWR